MNDNFDQWLAQFQKNAFFLQQDRDWLQIIWFNERALSIDPTSTLAAQYQDNIQSQLVAQIQKLNEAAAPFDLQLKPANSVTDIFDRRSQLAEAEAANKKRYEISETLKPRANSLLAIAEKLGIADIQLQEPYTEEALHELFNHITSFRQWRDACMWLHKRARELHIAPPAFQKLLIDKELYSELEAKIVHMEQVWSSYAQVEVRAKKIGWKKCYAPEDRSEEGLVHAKIEITQQEAKYRDFLQWIGVNPPTWINQLISFPLTEEKIEKLQVTYQTQIKWQKGLEQLKALLPPEEHVHFPQMPLKVSEMREVANRYRGRLDKLHRTQQLKDIISLRWIWEPALKWLAPARYIDIIDRKFGLPPHEHEMIYVYPGDFQMGALWWDNRLEEDEHPRHWVRIGNGYWIGKYPVTQDLYQAIAGYNPSHFKGERNPVETVSWTDAIWFCNQLSIHEQLAPVYQLPEGFTHSMSGDTCNELAEKIKINWQAEGYRLPTEAEWERAARIPGQSQQNLLPSSEQMLSSTSTASSTELKQPALPRHRGGQLYAGRNFISPIGWHKNNSQGRSHEVGLKQSNLLGIYDMSGNVWEWCWDGWSADMYGRRSLGKKIVLDPKGEPKSTKRVFRGGSWGNTKRASRVSFRYADEPGYRYGDLGFRLVRLA